MADCPALDNKPAAGRIPFPAYCIGPKTGIGFGKHDAAHKAQNSRWRRTKSPNTVAIAAVTISSGTPMRIEAVPAGSPYRAAEASAYIHSNNTIHPNI
jgi:hypothetical protein